MPPSDRLILNRGRAFLDRAIATALLQLRFCNREAERISGPQSRESDTRIELGADG